MNWAGRKVLVTGSRGFVGQHLKRHLERVGADVVELQRPAQDLTQPETLKGCCDGAYAVIHAAGSAHVNHINAEQVKAVNVSGTANILAQARQSGVKKFVLVSSILADPAYDTPRSSYGQSKADAEALVVKACRRSAAESATGMSAAIARPANVYGPGMRGNLMTLLRLIQKRRLPPLPRLESRLSLVGVDDLCLALIAMAATTPSLENTSRPSPDVPIYPVTDGQLYRLKQIELGIRQACRQEIPKWSVPAPVCYAAALLAEILGRLLPWKNVPGLRTWRTMTRDQPVDDSITRRELSYNPRSNFYDALPSIIEYQQASEGRQ
ncbi:NAD-dependent epimerase/dehydratase family protein [Pseudohongiella nitratireducens]|uniref:NAD-dependent epimerase/dehydratase family protein n=1 Tax=Pseudohongiella nitratireducens TaxID=1768907 RepID=UPI0030ED8619|tara:strand:- start:89 stop:1060 length:972 start_codon:yes stop_codon:yes gene_type:complete